MNEYVFYWNYKILSHFQSICMATAFGVWNAQLEAIVKFVVFVISLVLFTCGLLIGAAIKTDLADQLMSILISFSVISVVIVIVAVVLSFWKDYKYYTIGVYIGAQILLFINNHFEVKVNCLSQMNSTLPY
ncbi:uncharacterized protein DC041_0005121 [Schistosoma bovis]|uniref:Uncharacterized protein n=1 Tax=Schistosoma bovis TaxID=6184 RepID=A0A430PY37_SCHBO|nr:uncharacterized protein DC041_0005121 [Schistosoma bovis]